jgi:hypothetical protein
MDEAQWATQEFGGAQLGDERRTKRLIAMGAQVAGKPAGNITAVFTDAAEREAAFRFVENEDVESGELTRSAAHGAAARARGERFVFAPVDGTSLNLSDDDGRRRLGRVGTLKTNAQGIQVMTGIGISADGTPLGILGQAYWTRDRTGSGKKNSRNQRRVQDKETKYWLDVMNQAHEAMQAQAPGTRLWFQQDRGADAWPVLRTVEDAKHWITVRAAWDRRLVTPDEHQRYLWETMQTASLRGAYSIEVPASGDGKRAARTALLVVRAAEVTLDLLAKPSKRRLPTAIWAVWVCEQGSTPDAEDPIEWMLLTNYPVLNFSDAELVIHGYSQRWRIEQFHRAWKSGACRVEDTQLGDRDHIIIWAAILASVAMRIVRLTYFARHRPDQSADVELTRHEIDAAILVSKTKNFPRGAKLTIAQAVQLIAQCGGYVGKSSGGPPGVLVLARGLGCIQPVAKVLENL